MHRFSRHLLQAGAAQPARPSFGWSGPSSAVSSSACLTAEARIGLVDSQQRQASTSSVVLPEFARLKTQGMSDILASMLSPSERRAAGLEPISKAKWKTFHAKPKGRVVKIDVEAFERPRSQEHRHQFPGFKQILLLVEKGDVVPAMTRFIDATQPRHNGSVDMARLIHRLDPHTVNSLVQNLATLAIQPSHYFQGHKQPLVEDDEPMWMPPQIGESRPRRRQIRVMQPQVLAIYALASVYDVATMYRVLPSGASTARMLRAFARHLKLSTFEAVMKLALLAMCGVSIHDAQILAERPFPDIAMHLSSANFPVQLLAAVIETLGDYGRTQDAETILQWWMGDKNDFRATLPTQSLPKTVQEQRREALQSLPLCSWPSNAELFAALIHASVQVDDLAASRSWLMLYRNIVASLPKLAGDKSASSAPYLAHLMGIAKVPGKNLKQNTSAWESGIDLRHNAISDLVMMLMQDGLPLDEGIYGIILNFQIGTGRLSQAVQLVQSLVQPVESRQRSWSMHKALFNLDREWSIQNGPEANRPYTGAHAIFNSPRELFCQLALCLDNMTRTPWKADHKLDVLNAALAASLARTDLPLALAVVLTLEQLDPPQCSRDTWEEVVKAIAYLRRHGGQVDKFDEAKMKPSHGRTMQASAHRQEVENNIKEDLIARGLASNGFSQSALPPEEVVDLTLRDHSYSNLPFWSEKLDATARINILRDLLSQEIVKATKGPADAGTTQASVASWVQDVRDGLKAAGRQPVDMSDADILRAALRDVSRSS